MSRVAIISVLGLTMICCSFSSVATMVMMGGDGDSSTTPSATPSATPSTTPSTTRSTTPSTTPTPSPPAPAPASVTTPSVPSRPISTNGRCGPKFGKTRCGGKACCSQWGWCGGEKGKRSAWCVKTTSGHWNGEYDGTA